MKRRSFVLASLAAAGCQRNRKKVIAVIPKATSHMFWLSVQAGAMAAAEELNVEVLWNGPASETEYSRQIQIVDSMAARRVDGLAIAATERKALVQSVERAFDAGIPVTVFDSGLDTEKYTSWVATDNVEGGRLGARTLAGLLQGKGKAGIVMHAPGSVSTGDREKGFEEAMAAEFKGIEIVARQFGQSDRARARAATENILTAFPNIDGLFCSSEPSTVGAALAVKGRELSGKVKIVGFDAADSLVEDLRGGTIDVLVVQDPFKIGFEAVNTLVQKLNGKTPPRRLDLQARAIRRQDLEQPEVRQLLSPDVKRYLNK
ncbi:MAG TPA: sugar ABC transporter substrate-binding protein [Solibacterales bacterium]|nr:sugar ABC transporter substrate-binding protein [Bryobacterales bacterium]